MKKIGLVGFVFFVSVYTLFIAGCRKEAGKSVSHGENQSVSIVEKAEKVKEVEEESAEIKFNLDFTLAGETFYDDEEVSEERLNEEIALLDGKVPFITRLEDEDFNMTLPASKLVRDNIKYSPEEIERIPEKFRGSIGTYGFIPKTYKDFCNNYFRYVDFSSLRCKKFGFSSVEYNSDSGKIVVSGDGAAFEYDDVPSYVSGTLIADINGLNPTIETYLERKYGEVEQSSKRVVDEEKVKVFLKKLYLDSKLKKFSSDDEYVKKFFHSDSFSKIQSAFSCFDGGYFKLYLNQFITIDENEYSKKYGETICVEFIDEPEEFLRIVLKEYEGKYKVVGDIDFYYPEY